MTRSLSRRILLKSAVVSSLLGATVGGAALQPTGSRRPQPEARRIAAAKPGGPGTFEVLVTDSPVGLEGERNVTDGAAMSVLPGDGSQAFELVGNLPAHRYRGQVREDDGYTAVELDVTVHGALMRSLALRVRSDLDVRRLWLGRGYLHWDAGRVRFPDLIATTPFWDEIWFAKVQNEGAEVASEERLGYGYGTFDGLLGLGLSDGYRYVMEWGTHADNYGRDYRTRWLLDDEPLVESTESVFVVPGGVGLFFALPTATYCRTATMAFCAPKPAAWACCTVGIS